MREGQVVAIVDDDASVRQAIDGLLRSAGFPLRRSDPPTSSCGRPIPVIIVTAHGDAEVRARALDAGAEAFLRKPFDGDVLVAVAESVTREP
jgi:FixJ family two-component response regulator